jgi:hypothetical protein
MCSFFDLFFGKSEPIKIYTLEELNPLNVNELKKIVYSIHHSLKTNKNIEWTVHSIESHLYNLE